jgi:hypothetical protein
VSSLGGGEVRGEVCEVCEVRRGEVCEVCEQKRTNLNQLIHMP